MHPPDPCLQVIRRALEPLRGLGIEMDSESECSLAHDAVAALNEIEDEVVPKAPEDLTYETFERVTEDHGDVWFLKSSVDKLQHIVKGRTKREAALIAAQECLPDL